MAWCCRVALFSTVWRWLFGAVLAQGLMRAVADRMKLSNRAYARVLKVSRTIADLAESAEIGASHIAEAVQYRALDQKYWG